MSMWLPKAPALAMTLAASVLWSPAVKADTLEAFTAILNGAQEVPPVESPSQGLALVTFNKTNSNLCWAISFSPLSANETVAHFHGPGAPGQSADVTVPITPNPSPLGSPKNGCAVIDKEQAKDLRKGLWYINIHSMDAPLGEIRGQVFPTKIKYKNVPPIASPSGAFVD